MFLGFVALAGTIRPTHVTKTSAGVPTEPSSAPTYRVYGPAGLMANGTGTLSSKDTGTVTGATNASPIVITSNNHKLQTGMRVTISGVLGNTNANGTFSITWVSSNTFSLDGSTGNGAYTSGGTWKVTGLYDVALTPTTGDGYDAGVSYTLVVTQIVSAVTSATTYTFGVV